MARWGMSSVVVLLPEELSTQFNGCPMEMIEYWHDDASQEARLLLRYANEVGETIQNIKMMRKRWYNDQTYVENNSKPPLNALKWTISTSYHTE
ncbi:unnamed protein product [Rhizophagus irregularis]|nr:unnamed protein product [Rhizophagus irregularis]